MKRTKRLHLTRKTVVELTGKQLQQQVAGAGQGDHPDPLQPIVKAYASKTCL